MRWESFVSHKVTCVCKKSLTVTVTAPILPRIDPDSDEDVESPPPPRSPTEKGTMDYQLIVHVKDVIDGGALLSEDLPEKYLPDEDDDSSRIHIFKPWRGKVNGIGPGANGFA